MRYKSIIIMAISLLIALSISILAEANGEKLGEEINWYVISNGGTDGGSVSFELKGTVSQTAIGSGVSASFGLSHGYWLEGCPESCLGLCGDANSDETVNVSDAVRIINYVFVGGQAPQPVLACGDANNDGTVNVSDAVKVINYVFVGGAAPGDCAPGSPNWTDGDCCPFTP